MLFENMNIKIIYYTLIKTNDVVLILNVKMQFQILKNDIVNNIQSL